MLKYVDGKIEWDGGKLSEKEALLGAWKHWEKIAEVGLDDKREALDALGVKLRVGGDTDCFLCHGFHNASTGLGWGQPEEGCKNCPITKQTGHGCRYNGFAYDCWAKSGHKSKHAAEFAALLYKWYLECPDDEETCDKCGQPLPSDKCCKEEPVIEVGDIVRFYTKSKWRVLGIEGGMVKAVNIKTKEIFCQSPHDPITLVEKGQKREPRFVLKGGREYPEDVEMWLESIGRDGSLKIRLGYGDGTTGVLGHIYPREGLWLCSGEDLVENGIPCDKNRKIKIT